MPLGKRQRKILKAVGLVVAGLLLLWLSLPLWFPWVLPPLAEHAGVHYARYQREGYRRFSLYELTYTNQSVKFSAQQVGALVPTVWLARLAMGAGKAEQPYLRINDWHLESLPATTTNGSIYLAIRKWEAELQRLQRLVPFAVLSNGTIRVQNTPVDIPDLIWSRGSLWGKIEVPKLKTGLSASWSNAPPYELRIQSDSLHLQSSIRFSTNLAGLTLQGTSLWWSNRIDLQAQFGRTDILPEQASLQARNFKFAARILRLPGYENISGSLAARWERGHFVLDLDTRACPQAAQTNLPPVNLELHARGDTNSAVIETAALALPWLRAELSEELAIHFTGQLLREPVKLELAADLSRQPWFRLEGNLYGGTEFIPSGGRFPTARFHLSGLSIGTTKLKAKSAGIEGGLDWPWLQISEAHAVFEDGSTASVSANLEMQQQLVEAGRFAFSGPLVRRWLPRGYTYQSLVVAGQFQGPLKEPSHSGHLDLSNFAGPDLRPLGLAFDWQGKLGNLSRLAADLSAGSSSLQVRGALDLEKAGGELRLNALTLRKSGTSLLALERPTRFFFHHPDTFSPWHAQVDSLHWTGSAGDIQAQAAVDWPHSGSIKASIHAFRSELFEDFLKPRAGPFELRALALSAAWTNGPVNFGLELSAAGGTNIPFAAELKLTGDAKGVSLQRLDLSSASSPIIMAKGFLPLTFNPAAPSSLVHIDPDVPLHLEATAGPQDFLWDKVTTWTGVRLRGPDLNLNLSGTANAPRGEVQLQVRQIQLAKSKQPMPKLDNLQLDLELNRQEAHIAGFQLFVQGQPVTLTGTVPLGEIFWEELAKKRIPDLKKATAQLRMDHAKIAAFAGLYPAFLSPQGELDVDLSLLPGFKLEGQLTVQNARTRPLPSLGPVQGISVRMKFHENTLLLQSATADIGGATVRMAGQADLRGTNWLKDRLPPFSLTLRGTNVPLTRQPEAIIRGDLNLAAVKTHGAPPSITGTVSLHDSFFLGDLKASNSGNIAALRQRPPYFSITNPLLADWRLAVQVVGNRFLKVRSTPFNGEASVNLQLKGSLKDPMALGEVKIDTGVVNFPFGGLTVQHGFVTLASENPHQPQILVTATSKQFGYDIKMQVSGPADAPVIEFTSIPPLSSEQILLLLTTGQLPEGTFTLTPQQRAQTLGMFLARDLLAKLGIGLSQQRLTIYSDEQISETGKPTYRIEFKLTANWSLVAEYDRFGDFNAGAKWRIYSK
ncbi:MAG: hypothetical protein JWO20_2606 [Candidatus Angelobacter sp.]|nr:hypothetical protein [Candidatus Angelobacter sp.]